MRRALFFMLALGAAVPSGAQDSTQPPVRVVRPDAGDTDAGAGADRWQRLRSGRFKRAPVREGANTGPVTLRGTAPVPIEPSPNALKGGAMLRQLDKMTGETRTFEMGADTVAQIDRLRIQLEACRAPDDNAPFGTMAFLRIWDTKYPDRPPAFSGWMFADSPALSALDHPRYDLWVISCTTSAGAASSGKE